MGCVCRLHLLDQLEVQLLCSHGLSVSTACMTTATLLLWLIPIWSAEVCGHAGQRWRAGSLLCTRAAVAVDCAPHSNTDIAAIAGSNCISTDMAAVADPHLLRRSLWPCGTASACRRPALHSCHSCSRLRWQPGCWLPWVRLLAARTSQVLYALLTFCPGCLIIRFAHHARRCRLLCGRGMHSYVHVPFLR